MRKKWEEDIESCMTKASRKALNTAWKRWEGWVEHAQREDPAISLYSPPVELYCTFINYYLSLYAPDTVSTYLKRINTVARERGRGPLVKPENLIWVKRTYRAAAKRLGHYPGQRRLPLTVDLLAEVRSSINLEVQDGRVLWAILCVGVYALARIGELVPGPASELRVRLEDVSIRGSKGTLSLVGTKTDHKREGVTLFFFRNDSLTCPITAMNAFLTGRSKSRREAPLFIDARGVRITQKWVVERLRTALSKAGLRGEDYCGISLRRGGAQTLLRMKANDKIIMGMGRWTSSCYTRYLKVEEDDIRRWQTAMATAKLSPSSRKRKSTSETKKKEKGVE